MTQYTTPTEIYPSICATSIFAQSWRMKSFVKCIVITLPEPALRCEKYVLAMDWQFAPQFEAAPEHLLRKGLHFRHMKSNAEAIKNSQTYVKGMNESSRGKTQNPDNTGSSSSTYPGQSASGKIDSFSSNPGTTGQATRNPLSSRHMP